MKIELELLLNAGTNRRYTGFHLPDVPVLFIANIFLAGKVFVKSSV
ncbi:MAG: hypothetical protein HKN68_07820 [Saprospiraceae bacterium]|nr:hypothetical protein [Saprospiraceae bacterium]